MTSNLVCGGAIGGAGAGVAGAGVAGAGGCSACVGDRTYNTPLTRIDIGRPLLPLGASGFPGITSCCSIVSGSLFTGGNSAGAFRGSKRSAGKQFEASTLPSSSGYRPATSNPFVALLSVHAVS